MVMVLPLKKSSGVWAAAVVAKAAAITTDHMAPLAFFQRIPSPLAGHCSGPVVSCLSPSPPLRQARHCFGLCRPWRIAYFRAVASLGLKPVSRRHWPAKIMAAFMTETPGAGSRLYPTRPFLAVSLAVFREGRVLLASRAAPPFDKVYTLPGGVVEAGETLTEAACRELLEETGIVAEIAGFTGYTEFV